MLSSWAARFIACQGSSQTNASETIRNPDEWTTGGDPATKKQKAYIAVLEERAGGPVHGLDGATKAEASERIEELRGRTGE
ncbi:hypothetical protein AURDEDRAFT_115701 [Auricularia subglabra TFB-10046 SS5]|uniref:DUF3072 domain-containing protein n=1 Tax=Auricularia subglabra (strain TFB-10046 / SS5) TaxID=717982 RepID=J0WY49_AURST|nr:hypothetical protein AURDEDRAFT_115701 [Auricularia subglabra TFB-10046 SS5]